MIDLLAGFIQELRAAGLPVSLTENLDAMEAVQHVPLEDREAFKYALGATLVKSNAHWKAFETIFEVYFSLRGPQYEIAEGEPDADALDECCPPQVGALMGAVGGEGDDPAVGHPAQHHAGAGDGDPPQGVAGQRGAVKDPLHVPPA